MQGWVYRAFWQVEPAAAALAKRVDDGVSVLGTVADAGEEQQI
jgi:hypothetical protein